MRRYCHCSGGFLGSDVVGVRQAVTRFHRHIMTVVKTMSVFFRTILLSTISRSVGSLFVIRAAYSRIFRFIDSAVFFTAIPDTYVCLDPYARYHGSHIGILFADEVPCPR